MLALTETSLSTSTLWFAGVEAGEFRAPSVVNALMQQHLRQVASLNLFCRFIESSFNSDCDLIGDAVHDEASWPSLC